MKFRSLVVAGAAAAAVSAAAPSAMAACTPGTSTGCQQVTGAVVSSNLAFGTVAATASLSTITPGSTMTGTGAIPVVSVGNWTLKVADDNAGTNTGHMVSGGGVNCTGSETALANPLSVYPTALGGLDSFASTYTSGSPLNVPSAATTFATGTTSDTVTANYKVAVGSGEQLTALCDYSLTAVYTLS